MMKILQLTLVIPGIPYGIPGGTKVPLNSNPSGIDNSVGVGCSRLLLQFHGIVISF